MLALSRDLIATLNSFLRVLVTSWSLQSCVYSYKIVLVLCRRVLVSSTLGKKYWQLIMTRKSNSNAKSLQDERTTLWRKREKSLNDEFGRIATALKSPESSCGGHKQHPALKWKNLYNFLGAPFDDLKGPYVAAKKDLKALVERLTFLALDSTKWLLKLII